MDVGRRLARLGETESGARRALIVDQTAFRRDRERGVREDQLCGRETTSTLLGDAGPIAEERDLHAESSPFESRSRPVTYHHSVRNSGWLP